MNKQMQKEIYLNDEFFPGCKYEPLFEYFPPEMAEHIVNFLPGRDDDNCKQRYIDRIYKMFPDEEDYFVNDCSKYQTYVDRHEPDFQAEFEEDLSDDDIDKWIP